MKGPVDRFGLASMQQGAASSKQTGSDIDTDPRKWKPGMSIEFAPKLHLVFLLQLPMYCILVLAGFGEFTKFELDAAVLTTLASIAAASTFPHSISIAIHAIKSVRNTD